MDDALKTHCPNCTFVNANTMQKCTRCNTTLRKRNRSHENDENDENYSEDEADYDSCIQTTTNVANTNSSNNKNNNINAFVKQSTRSPLESSSSYLSNIHGQTGPRMISTLFSTAAGAPVMVSEASLQKAKLKYGGSSDEENYNDTTSGNSNNNNNSNYTINTNLTSMHNRPNERYHETKQHNNYNFQTNNSHIITKENIEINEQINEQNQEIETSLLGQQQQEFSENFTKQTNALEDLKEDEVESHKEKEQEAEEQYDNRSNNSVSMHECSPLKSKNANAKDNNESITDNAITSNSSNNILITPVSNLLQPARIGLRAGTRRGFVPPQRIKEIVKSPNEIGKLTISDTNAHSETAKETEKVEEEQQQQESKEVQYKLDRPLLSSTTSSLTITSALELKRFPQEPNCNGQKEQLVSSVSTAHTSPLATANTSFLSKPQIKISKLSAVGFDYHTLRSEPTRDIPTVGAIMSGEFAFSTILCSDALRAVCGLTATEVHLSAKHWQHMLITLGASEAHVPLDWITHIVRSSMIEVRSLAVSTRSLLREHAALTESNSVPCQSTLFVAASTSITPTLESSSMPHLFFTPTTMALYMCEKYNTEIVLGHHSALREVVEGDVPSASLMILQLTEVCPDRSAPHTRVVRLCDGFYHLKVNFDLPLSNLLREKVLNVGQKMAICGARYLLSQQTTPLECLEKLVLAVNYNCVRAVSVQSPLGLCHCQPAPLSIHLVHPNGGMVSALQGMVIRTLPVFYISHEVSVRRRNDNELNSNRSSTNSNNNSMNTAASLPMITHKVVRNAYAQQREFALLASQIRSQCNVISNNNANEQSFNTLDNFNGSVRDHSSYNNVINNSTMKSVNATLSGISTIKVSCVRSVVIANDGVEALIQQWHDWDVSKMNTKEILHLCDGAHEYGENGMNFAGQRGRVSNGHPTDATTTNYNNNSNSNSNSNSKCKYSYESDEGQAPHEGSEIVIYALKPSKSQMACAPFAHAKLFYSARHLHFSQVQHVSHYQREFVKCFSSASRYQMGSVVDVVGLFVGTVQLSHGTFILLLMEEDTYCLLQVPLPESHRVLSFAIPSKLNVPVAICNATFVCYEDKIAGSDCTRVFANEFTLLLLEQQCKATYLHSALKHAAELVQLINNKPHKYNSRIVNILESLQEVNNNNSNNNSNISEKFDIGSNDNTNGDVNVNNMNKAEEGGVTTETFTKIKDSNKIINSNNGDDLNNLETDNSTCLVNAVTSLIAIPDPSEENAWNEVVCNNSNKIINATNINFGNYNNKLSEGSKVGKSHRIFSPTARVPYYLRNDKKETLNYTLTDHNHFDSENNKSLRTNGVKLISRDKELSMTIPPFTNSAVKQTSPNIIKAKTRGRSEEQKESLRDVDVYHFYGNIIDLTYVYADVANAELLDRGSTEERSVSFLRGESIDIKRMLHNTFLLKTNAQKHDNNDCYIGHNILPANGIENSCGLNNTANGVSTSNNDGLDSNKHSTSTSSPYFYLTWQYGKELTECKRAKLEHPSLLHSMLESVLPLRKLCSLASDARETSLALERSEVIAEWTKSKAHSFETDGDDCRMDNSSGEEHNQWWRFFSSSCVIDNNNDNNSESNTSIYIKQALEQKRLCWLSTEWRTAMQLLRQALRRTLFKFTTVCHDVTDGQNMTTSSNNNSHNINNNNTTESEYYVSKAFLVSDHCDVRSMFDSNDKSR